MVGIYSRPADVPSGHAVVFAAQAIGGMLSVQPGETVDVRYFALDELPAALSFGHRRRILDTIQAVSGAVVVQRPMNPEKREPSRAALYRLRDQSGLSPDQFYMEYFNPDRIDEERRL